MRPHFALDPRGAARAWLAGSKGSSAIADRGAIAPPAFSPRLFAASAESFDLGEETLFLAWEIAGLARSLTEPELRGLHLAIVAALAESSRGSTRLPLVGDGAEAALGKLLDSLGATEDERRSALAFAAEMAAVVEGGDGAHRLSALVGPPLSYRPLVVDEGHLYSQKMWELERRVAELVSVRLRAPAATDSVAIERALADIAAAPPMAGERPLRLSTEQRDAVKAAHEGAITLISGEPGTGKTSIIVSILRVLERLGNVPLDAVALAAPTGKAADRMRRSIEDTVRAIRKPAFADRTLLLECPPARTLHRLLGYSPRHKRFRHHERNPLRERLVIVDESSMIDLALLARLLRALRDDARVVLLGDAQQLPSVDAGAVFRDLCAAGGARVRKLRESHRMNPKDPAGRQILEVARSINAAKVPEILTPSSPPPPSQGARIELRGSPEAITFEGVEMVEASSAKAREAVLSRWYAARIRSLPGLGELVRRTYTLEDGRIGPTDAEALDALFVHFERSKVLCLTRRRATGVEAVNAWFQVRHREELDERLDLGSNPGVLPGSPILVLKNEYERGLFNGDQGLALRVRFEGGVGLSAVFRRDAGFVVFPLEAIRPVMEVAWAITVHKAQGSELDHGMLVLPETSTPLLSRELIYTAVSRSRRSVLLVGSRDKLEKGIETPVVRLSGLATRLERLRLAAEG